MVLDKIDGGTLNDQLCSGAFYEDGDAIEKAIQVGVDLCEALEEIHEVGVIHRDIKPDNIMFDNGVTKLLDLMIHAYSRDSLTFNENEVNWETSISPEIDLKHTHLMQSYGTPAYMSPEAMKGNYSVASDVYSIGCVLFEALASENKKYGIQTPFNTESTAYVMYMFKLKSSPDVREYNPNVNQELNRIVKKCLDPKPENRYQSVEELGYDLRDCSNPKFDSMPDDIGGDFQELVAPGFFEQLYQLVRSRNH